MPDIVFVPSAPFRPSDERADLLLNADGVLQAFRSLPQLVRAHGETQAWVALPWQAVVDAAAAAAAVGVSLVEDT